MKRFLTCTVVFGCFSLTRLAGQPAYDLLLSTLYSHTIPTISADSLKLLMANDPPVLLDTRSNVEFMVCHLKQAKWIDYDTFEPEMVAGLEKTTPLIVYCSVGYRSEKIGEKLKQLGFTDVRNLYGGIFQWKNEGYPVVNPRGERTDSVHTYNRLWSVWLQKGIKVYE